MTCNYIECPQLKQQPHSLLVVLILANYFYANASLFITQCIMFIDMLIWLQCSLNLLILSYVISK